MNSTDPLFWGIVGSAMVVGFAISVVSRTMLRTKRKKAASAEAEGIVSKAQAQGRQILEDFERRSEENYRRQSDQAKEEQQRELKKFENELSRARRDSERRERKLDGRQTALDRKFEGLEKREKVVLETETEIEGLHTRLQDQAKDLESIRDETKRRCAGISGLTIDEAKKLLLESLEVDVRQDAAALVRRVDAETKEVAAKKARQIIALSIQRCAADQVSESSVSVVHLPSDDLKGRIIGREGRNIRALEAATGCNIVVDDTPEAVVLSCFDPIRREIARQTLERLISDGRFHPGRIEDVVAKVEKELNDTMRQLGEDTVFELGLPDMHPELTKILGRLKYRTSYGQNILAHSIEVSHLCGFMAAELGTDIKAAKRAGLLHDLGKALTQEIEGTHAMIGADFARKYSEKPGVVHAIAAHHNEVEPRTIIAVLVQAADAISAARPGARRETLENYVKRLKSLEEIADSFQGVTKAYALQAGREIRIMVDPTEIDDNEACLLARDISKRIEKEVQYPGQIKIMVCREVRVIEYAK